MSGDYTRFTFDPLKRYSGVLMQQGRVQLDSDWNEEIDILQAPHPHDDARHSRDRSACPMW